MRFGALNPPLERLFEEILDRYGRGMVFPKGWRADEAIIPCVIRPQDVNDDHHLVIHDLSIRDRVRHHLWDTRYSHCDHPNAVLVLAPIQ